MNIVTLDFETYYDSEYSLKKMTTEEYINDPRFEVIMLGIIWPDGAKEIVTGTHEQIRYRLEGYEDWDKVAVLAHNTMFDGAILGWKFGIRPKLWLDTLSMARAMFGMRGNSLEALADKYGLQEKGKYILNALGKRREDFEPHEFQQYAEYCIHDTELCLELFNLMGDGWYSLSDMDKRSRYPGLELELIDRILRMYIEPTIRLNHRKLSDHLEGVRERKGKLLDSIGVSKDDLMSNPKFAEVLESLGVAPPMKVSGRTGKPTYAFAKTDEGFVALQEHEDERVQALVAARLGIKSTLEETRTERFIGIAQRNEALPVPLRYSAARTHRLGGADKINLQNLPSRGAEAGKIKNCLEAPPGHVIIDSDSSNIEARMLAWLAGQEDLVSDFANGVDVYCKFASTVYGRQITKANPEERFVGKTVVLGCGYQTGKVKLQGTLKSATPSVDMPIEECERIVYTYRNTYSKIPDLWEQAEAAIQAIYDNQTMWLGREGVLLVDGRRGIKLPNGLYLSYPQLHRGVDKKRGKEGWFYKDEKGLTNIYGGKLIENVTQALARIVVMYQLLKIARRYHVPLTVHDSVLAIAKISEWETALDYVEQCMRWKPKWAEGCPINCEAKIGYTYGSTRLRNAFNENGDIA